MLLRAVKNDQENNLRINNNFIIDFKLASLNKI